jgi:hypothetical protein
LSLNWRTILIVSGILVAIAFVFGWLAGRESKPTGPRSEKKASFPFRSDDEETAEETGGEEDFDAEAMLESIGDAYGEITLVDEPLVLAHAVDVHPQPDDKTKPVGHFERGSSVYQVGKIEDWSLIGWPKDKPKSFGWIRASAEPPPSPEPEEDAGVVRGTVNFVGQAPTMKVPAARKRAEYCKQSPLEHNAVKVVRGRLADVFVRLRGVKGAWQPPESHAQIAYRACELEPRVQGVLAGQTIEIVNDDPTTHHVHAHAGSTSLFDVLFNKGAVPVEKAFFDEAIIAITCDTHKWERAFVFVADDPFFAVTEASGYFALEDVPAGSYTLETWHSQFGAKKEHNVRVSRGEPTEVIITYMHSDRPPKENLNELRGLF